MQQQGTRKVILEVRNEHGMNPRRIARYLKGFMPPHLETLAFETLKDRFMRAHRRIQHPMLVIGAATAFGASGAKDQLAARF